MYANWHQNNPNKSRRSDRSKNGCLTCRRRRVRCNQQRPKCGHCLRLQLDCSWGTEGSTSKVGDETPQMIPDGIASSSLSPLTTPVPETVEQQPALPLPASPALPSSNQGPADFFDYASFLWDDPISPVIDFQSTAWTTSPDSAMSDLNATISNVVQRKPEVPVSVLKISDLPNVSQLLDHFKQSDAPPILAPVETKSRWRLMRNHLISMAANSLMVHYAILAFSALQLQRQSDRLQSDFSSYYAQSQEEISKSLLEHDGKVDIIGAKVQHVLAALFLLSYIDLVANRTTFAHPNLRKAYLIVSDSDQGDWDLAEKTLVRWIRLLDARAVSAGGEGLFLGEDHEAHDFSGSLSPSERDAEAVLADILSQPALRFFQKTQSFMGRITKIDQWHRSRGTVEDETEVMALAAQIQKDNHKLYRHRHPILDIAVTGRLEAPLLAPALAEQLTRTTRMAMANFHASFIHLHRVAYKHLPRTVEVHNAMSVMRQTTRAMVDAQGPNDTLPVNMLWPLLMWGSEEENPDDRVWILSIVRSMSKTVSNAGITADVLQNVWQRQDQTGQRADIRTVMHETFNSCFAIV